jgi:hypothetical protein
VLRGARGQQHLLHRPTLPLGGLAVHGRRREGVEGFVVGRVHGDQLALQVGAELGDRHAVLARDAGELVAIGLRLGGHRQVEQPRVPRGHLHALEAQRGGPLRDRRPRIERRCVAGELCEVDAGALDVRCHGDRDVLDDRQPLAAVVGQPDAELEALRGVAQAAGNDDVLVVHGCSLQAAASRRSNIACWRRTCSRASTWKASSMWRWPSYSLLRWPL